MGTRRWEDPRSGQVWNVELTGGTGVGARAPGDYLPEVRPQRITFHRDDEAYDMEYREADKPLDAHSTEELQALLDRAQESTAND